MFTLLHFQAMGPTCDIISGSSDNSVRVWDIFAHNNPWEISSHGWIISLPHYQRLMWVPPEFMKMLNLPNALIISSESPAKVDFTDSRIGPAWHVIHHRYPYVFNTAFEKFQYLASDCLGYNQTLPDRENRFDISPDMSRKPPLAQGIVAVQLPRGKRCPSVR